MLVTQIFSTSRDQPPGTTVLLVEQNATRRCSWLTPGVRAGDRAGGEIRAGARPALRPAGAGRYLGGDLDTEAHGTP